MKNIVFLILFSISLHMFGQYDVYAEFRYVGGVSPYNGNVQIGIQSAILFNEYLQSPSYPPQQFTYGETLANSTSNSSLNWNARLDFGSEPSLTENGVVNLNSREDFSLTGQGYSLSGSIRLVPKIEITASHTTGSKCYSEDVTFNATVGHPTEAYSWSFYTASDPTEKPLIFNSQSKTLNLTDLFPDNPTDHIEEVITFVVTNNLNGGYKKTIDYSWLSCGLNLTNIEPEPEKCAGTNNGSVRFEFEDDLPNNSSLRVYLYEGTPPDNVVDDLEKDNPTVAGNTPQTISDSNDQLINANGTYYWEYQGLAGAIGGKNYFVVHQVLNGDGTVSSAAITDGFKIESPTEITASSSLESAAACIGENTVYSLSADGGYLSGGSSTLSDYEFRYRVNGGVYNSTSSTLEIPASLNDQTVDILVEYTGNSNNCTNDVNNPHSFIVLKTPVAIEINDDPSQSFGLPPSASGLSNGSVRITLAQGDGSFNYNLYRFDEIGNSFILHDSESNTTEDPYTFENLPEGRYQVTVSLVSGSNCSDTSQEFELIANQLPTIENVNATAPSCTGQLDGSITLQVTGGTPPLQFRWYDSNGVQIPGEVNNSLTSLAPGTYSFRAISAGGDFDIEGAYSEAADIEVPQPTSIEIMEVSPTNASCFGADDGSLEISVSGATEYDYSLNGGLNWTALTGTTITNLGSGFYEVIIRKRNTPICVSPPSSQVEIVEPTEIIINPTVQDVSTNGGNDGAITISVAGGLPEIDANENYIFSWVGLGPNNTSFSSNTQNITGLIAGRYEITVSDSNGCSSTPLEIEITEPGPLSINNITIVSQMNCPAANDAIITADVTGTSPVTFDWYRDGSLYAQTIDDNTIENLPPGDYQLFLNDGSVPNALESAIVTIDAIEVISVDITATGTCANSTEGSIIISNPQGGTPGYAYSIDGTNFQPSGNFSFLNSGNYTVTVRDSNGCEMVQTDVVVDSYPEILLDNENTIVLSVSAEGRSDGAISPIFTGGVPPFTYQWTGPNVNGTNTQDISGLAEGDYSILVTDANGCILNESFTITEPGELIVTASQTEVIPCSGDAFGEIAGQVTGGVAPYVLEWFQQINGSDTKLAEDSNLLADLGPGSYFLRATDANGISADSGIVVITEPDLLTASVLSTTSILCSGEATGAVEVTFSGGTAPYEFSWSNGDSSLNLTNVPSGEYTLFISDVNGCYTELTAVVEAAPDALQISNRDLLNVSEYNANDGSISLELSGGAFPFDIEWTQLSNGLVIGDQENISRLAAGRYQVTISDDNGCRLTEIFEITQPDIVEETIIQPACEGDTNGSISLLVNQGNGTFTYDWSTGETTNTITNLAPGSYSVTVTGLENGPVTRTYLIEYPKPVEVDLGEDQTLCLDQELALDASIEDEGAIYSWTSNNGFTSNSPAINITQSGTYTIIVTSSSGCKAEGSISVDISTEEINAELAASTQAFVNETVVAVDISYPLPDRLEWIFPDEALVVSSDSDEAQLQFTEAGEYEIGIITYRGDCIAQQTKKIIINQSDSTVKEEATANGSKLVEDFLIYPNPSSGQFTADIHMTERGNISIKVFSLANNALIASKKERGASSYKVPFDISGLPAGVYAVLLETPYGKTLRKVIKK
ncbi:T9SS type A sorting domain-containing protein [Euzebyella saccharophila]|uniref:T9SS type A sorting domain-containing protein n=1 Tax=Euzebyella saccharophila TaxID=679664 RepID=A0ABV8JN07_9FLAO|nr:T9SS type A sorting domain-containing protein [Euzebyella saccharophila]